MSSSLNLLNNDERFHVNGRIIIEQWHIQMLEEKNTIVTGLLVGTALRNPISQHEYYSICR